MIETQDLESIVNKIEQIVKNSPDRKVTGVRLGVEVRDTFPSFFPAAYRARNLTQFINKHVPGVREVGRSGPEIVWGLLSDTDKPTRPSKWKVPGYAWKTFITPKAKYPLYANPEGYEVKTLSPSAPDPGSPWLKIDSSQESDHLQIAKDFLLTLDEPQRDAIRPTLEDQRWWLTFAMKVSQLGLFHQWKAFRHRGLWKVLSERLEAVERSAQPPQTFVSERVSVADPNADLAAPTPPPAPPQVQVHDIQAKPVDDSTAFESLLRRVVLGIVAKMSVQELGELRLPVGEVVKAIQQQ